MLDSMASSRRQAMLDAPVERVWGLYARYLLTPARDGTFVDAEIGIEPRGIERLVAGRFVRRWLAQSLEGLRRASADEQPGDERSQPATHEDG
jgi:hypothetical protein